MPLPPRRRQSTPSASSLCHPRSPAAATPPGAAPGVWNSPSPLCSSGAARTLAERMAVPPDREDHAASELSRPAPPEKDVQARIAARDLAIGRAVRDPDGRRRLHVYRRQAEVAE